MEHGGAAGPRQPGIDGAFGTIRPGPPIAVNRILSAVRPRCVGNTCANGNRPITAVRNRWNEGARHKPHFRAGWPPTAQPTWPRFPNRSAGRSARPRRPVRTSCTPPTPGRWPLGASCQPHRLDRVDPERLNDRAGRLFSRRPYVCIAALGHASVPVAPRQQTAGWGVVFHSASRKVSDLVSAGAVSLANLAPLRASASAKRHIATREN